MKVGAVNWEAWPPGVKALALPSFKLGLNGAAPDVRVDEVEAVDAG